MADVGVPFHHSATLTSTQEGQGLNHLLIARAKLKNARTVRPKDLITEKKDALPANL